ncbi:MAG: tetratricopeptide repeat protein [Planctomycetes bacterium]|nr:tetratricopeptide repeat protein [Planctomycetota bacterium]
MPEEPVFSHPIPLPESVSREMALSFEIGIASAFLRSEPGHRDALEMLGHALTRQGKHEAALEVDRKLVALQPDNAFVRYNLACSLSNLGRVDEALVELGESIDLGYEDLAFMQSDPDLAQVRRDPRYRRLLEKGKRGRT